MKNTLILLGFSILTLITTGCTPLPRHHTIQNSPRYIPQKPPSYHPLARIIPKQYPNAIQTRQNIVKLAYQQLGIRYQYGGSSPREGFDCSGLMHYLYQNGAGINIPRTSSMQRNKSQTLQYSTLQPADLLFFKTGTKTNHVGMYVGNHQFIHAPNRRSKVKITRMDNRYWRQHFVKFGTFLEN